MNLVNSGVDLIYIRDLLGHVSVKTTEVYARADAKLKKRSNRSCKQGAGSNTGRRMGE